MIFAPLVGTGGNPRIAPASPPPLVGPSDSSDAGAVCPVSEQRAVFAGIPKGESTSVLLGCARLQDGRKVELLSEIEAGGLCLQIVGIDNRVRECGNAPSEQEPPMTEAVAAQAIAQRNNSAPLEVYGATSADVTKVELRYTREGSSHRAPAELIRVTNGEALKKAGIVQPFGYFVGELPPDASNISAIALSSEGQTIGGDNFEQFLRDQPRGAFVSGPSS